MKKFLAAALSLLALAVALSLLALAGRAASFSDKRDSVVILQTPDTERTFCSGFFIDKTIIATAGHCVNQGEKVRVVLRDGRVMEGTTFHDDDTQDVALIRVDNKEPVSYTTLRCDYKPVLGDKVMAIGHPLDFFRWFVSFGQVGGYGQTTAPEYAANYIWHTAPIGPGNSGGPLMDIYGRVIGVISIGLGSDSRALNGASHIKAICKVLNPNG